MVALAKLTLGSFLTTVAPYVPTWDTPVNIARKATTLAVPLILVLGAANIPTVSAGPVSYALCMLGCLLAGGGSTCAVVCATANEPHYI
jgi:hypothetical protein